MKVLLTGSTGFVGINLLSFLNHQGFTTQNLFLRNKDWKIQLDKNADAIIHLAAKAHDTSNLVTEVEYFKINYDLTKELFKEFIDSKVKDFFFFSSVKAIADSVDVELSEEFVGSPQTPFGKSKKEAEQYLLSQPLPEGKRLFIIRPCMVHGPGNKGNLNLLYKIVEKGIPWPLASFENKRSFIGIDNLNYLILHMLKNDKIPSGIYNFADDQAISTNQLITIINNGLDKKPKLWKISKNLIEKCAKIGDRLHLPLNSERLKKLTESYVVSNQKIKTALGIEKLPYTAEEGLIKTIKSFKNQ